MRRTLALCALMSMPAMAIEHGTLVLSAEERAVAAQLNEAVQQMTSALPMTLDEETRLDTVQTINTMMIYNNTLVNYAANDINAAQLDALIDENVLSTICSNPQLKPMISLGVTMVYRYYGKDGIYISEIGIDTDSCTAPQQ